MSKYDPLGAYLAQRADAVELTFDEVSRLVGGLPASAYRWRAWWANDPTHVQAGVWLDHGRSVASLDLEGERVTFR